MLDASNIGLLSAFVAGGISFLSPCVLPLVPGYISYIAGTSLDELVRPGLSRARVSALVLSLLFVLGFSAVFIALGAGATAASEFLRQYQRELNYAAGGIVILFGLYLAGWLRLPWLAREARFEIGARGGRPLGAFLLGLAFAFGWTPCIGPVLGAILTIAATQEAVGSGVTLLSFYALGLGIPFLAAALFTGTFIRRLPQLKRFSRPLQIAAGVILVVMGIAMITGYLSKLAFWILERVPALGALG